MALAYLTINLDGFTGDDHPPISQYSTITLDPGADHIDEDADVIHVRSVVVSLDQQGKAATANGVRCVDGRVPIVAGVMYAVSAPNVLRDGPHYIPALTAGQVVDLSDYITPGAPLTRDQAAILTARIKALEDTPVQPATIRSQAGAGAYTTGDVVKVGQYAVNRRYDLTADVGTSYVAGGAPNYENVIGGNLANVDTATSNLTGAAALTGEDGNWNFLLGGYDTVVNGWANTVVGFHTKVHPGVNHCVIAGGSRHTAQAGAYYGTISGGSGHTVGGASATISGGTSNTATGNNAVVSGGNANQATGSAATVSGGSTNTAAGNNSAIVGGNSNTAPGLSSIVVGGQTNTASGIGATVAGGRSNTAAGDYSSARGYGAVTTHYGEDAHAALPFSTPGDAQTSRIIAFRQTTDATASDLRVNNASPPLCPENTTWAFRAQVVARRTDVDGENAAWEVTGTYKRDAGNTGALVGTPVVTSLGANGGNTWTLAVGSYSTGNLRLIVTGQAAKTIRWVGVYDITQVQG